MRKVFVLYSMIFTLTALTGGLTSCTIPLPQTLHVSMQEVRHNIQQAHEYIDAIVQLRLHTLYPEDFQRAHETLQYAETCLAAEQLDEAHASALESLAASRRILQHVYEDTIAQTAQTTKADIERLTVADPDNPLQDFIPKLNDILDYCDKIEAGQEVVELNRVLDDLEAVQQIEQNSRNDLKQILASDVSFPLGEYQLSAQGVRSIDAYGRKLVTQIKQYQVTDLNRAVLIKIKIIGYTDQYDFREDSDLIAQLPDDEQQAIPLDRSERRQFLNRHLSVLRANAIGTYIQHLLRQADVLEDTSSITLVWEIVGMGEAIPPGLASPFPIPDPRRRICKIYSYVTPADTMK